MNVTSTNHDYCKEYNEPVNLDSIDEGIYCTAVTITYISKVGVKRNIDRVGVVSKIKLLR